MWKRVRLSGVMNTVPRLVVAVVLALGVCGMAHAGEGEWSFLFEALYMNVYGHDQHVLTISETDFGPPELENSTAVSMDVDAGPSFRAELQYDRGEWGLGGDFFIFYTSLSAGPYASAADGPSGTIDEITYETADREYMSTGPGEVLYFRTLEDNNLQVWTVDFYGIRALAGGESSGLRLRLGMRFGDFDNDYRAVVGVEGVGGTRYDCSSNYGRMMGPYLGLAGDARFGRSLFRGVLSQSLLIGSAELTAMNRDFSGPFGESPDFISRSEFRKDEDVAIPVTEFRLHYTYRLTDHFEIGLGADTSTWWDVPVPPGVVPVEGGDTRLTENTIVFFGLSAAVRVTF